MKTLADSLRSLGHSIFSDKSYSSPVRNAQLNLEGKTHYCDENTMRYFHSRVLSSNDHEHGLIFSIIESVSLDHEHTRRGFRYVAFDVFGTIVSRVDLEHCVSSKDAARKAFYTWLNAFDTLAHYRATLRAMATRMESDAKAMRKIARAKADKS